MAVSQEPLQSYAVASFLQYLSPRLQSSSMPAMDPACSCASGAVVAEGVEWASARGGFARVLFQSDWQTEASPQEALKDRVT